MKALRIFLVLTLVLALCGCGGADTPTQPVATNPPPQTTGVHQDTTDPIETTVPETTVPETTVPETTAPPVLTVELEPVKEKNYANFRYQLTEVSTFTTDAKLSFSAHMPVVRTVVDGQTIDYLYAYNGQLMIEEGCTGYDYFGDGKAAMYNGAHTRFVNVNTGDVYLDSADIQQIIQMNARYYFVVYADHGKVYDLERGCFLEGLQVTDLTLSNVPRAIDDTVFEKLSYGTYRVYMGDGTVSGEITNVSFTDRGYIRETGSKLEVYDSNCTLMAVLNDAGTASDYASDDSNIYSWKYYTTGGFRNYTVVDINGTVILPGPFDGVQVHGDYIVVRDSQSMKGLYLADGTQLLETKYSDIFYRADLGVFQLTSTDGQKQVYIPGCGIFDLGDLSVSGHFIKDYSGNFMVVATGETIHLDKAKPDSNAALVDCKQGLIETYGGTTLLEPGYDFVVVTTEHIYKYQGGAWTVYQYALVTE